jgi:hypothetical protein
MNASIRKLTVAALALTAIISLHAQEATRTLTDMNKPGEWVSYQWNKAPNTVAVVPEFPTELKGQGEPGALQVKTNWPGGEAFAFSNVVPASLDALKVPYRVSKVSMWVKGSGTGHYIKLSFLANGQEKNATGEVYDIPLCAMTDNLWKKYEVAIPADWPQPLTVKAIAMHNWNLPQAVEATCYFTRLEVTGDPSQALP